MNLIFYYILQFFEFLLVVSVGIALVSFIFYYISRNFNIKFINAYGFFTCMDNFSLIMLSCSILKEITLIYCLFKLNSMSDLYLYVFLVFCFAYAFFSFNIFTFMKELVIGVIEYLIIYFLNLLSIFFLQIKQLKMIKYYIWILSAVLIACSIYFFAKNLVTVVTRDKNIRRNLFAK